MTPIICYVDVIKLLLRSYADDDLFLIVLSKVPFIITTISGDLSQVLENGHA